MCCSMMHAQASFRAFGVSYGKEARASLPGSRGQSSEAFVEEAGSLHCCFAHRSCRAAREAEEVLADPALEAQQVSEDEQGETDAFEQKPRGSS